MAKKKQLYDKEGNVVYPITQANCVEGMSDGENLVINSNVPRTSSESIITYQLVTPITEITNYTITLKAKLGEGKTGILTTLDGSNSWLTEDGNTNTKFVEIRDGIYRLSGKFNGKGSGRSTLKIHIGPYDLNVPSTIEWIKLERGTNATAYIPASEDVASKNDLGNYLSLDGGQMNNTNQVKNLNATFVGSLSRQNLLPAYITNPTKGVLITTGMPATDTSRIYIRIEGMSYTEGRTIFTQVSTAILSGGTIGNSDGFNYGLPIPEIKAFVYEGKVAFWFEQPANFCSLYVVINSTTRDVSRVATLTNAALPEDISGLTTIKLTNAIQSYKNLLKESYVPVSFVEGNNGHNYYLSEKPVDGKYYTVTIKGTCPSNKAFKGFNTGAGTVLFDGLTLDKNGIGTISFKWKNQSDNSYIRVISVPTTIHDECTIEWIKLEEGINSTVWTPQPEEIATYDNIQVGVINQINNDGIINLGGENNSYVRIPLGNVKVGNIFSFRADSIIGSNSSGYLSSINNKNAIGVSNLVYYKEGEIAKYVIEEDAEDAYFIIWNSLGGGEHPENSIQLNGCTLVKGNVIPSTYVPSIEDVKKALFDDMFKVAVGEYGSIDHSLAEPYIIDGVGHTYEEALYEYKFGIDGFGFPSAGYCNYNGKNLLIYNTSQGGNTINSWSFGVNPNLQVIRFVNGYKMSNKNNFHRCSKLEYVYGIIQYDGSGGITSDKNYRSFYYSTKLKHIELSLVGGDISFESCPLLDLESFSFLVGHSKSGSSFKVYVHPDVYSKLTDESNEEWNAVYKQAQEKNITFTTVEAVSSVNEEV